ncbi:hypothetical protein HK097_006222, partial [Rhizophlyctis rosea]
MRAAVIYRPVPPSHLGAITLETLPKPVLTTPSQVILRVHATSLTPSEQTWPEWHQTSDLSPRTSPSIPGLDVVGTVTEVGTSVSNIKIGDTVWGMLNPYENGSMAEYVVTSSSYLSKVPNSLLKEPTTAAAVPLCALTAYQTLHTHALIKPTDTITILGASGAVGTWLILLAKLFGCTVIGSASPANHSRVKRIGADVVASHSSIPALNIKTDILINVGAGTTHSQLAPYFPLIKRHGKFITIQTDSNDLKSPDETVESKFFIVVPDGKAIGEVAGFIDAGKIDLGVLREGVHERVFGLEAVRE